MSLDGTGASGGGIRRWDPLGADAFTSPAERIRIVRATYEYSRGNRMRYTDPLGLKSCPGSCEADCPEGVGSSSTAMVAAAFYSVSNTNCDRILHVLYEEMRI
jgi:hypothetical protein